MHLEYASPSKNLCTGMRGNTWKLLCETFIVASNPAVYGSQRHLQLVNFLERNYFTFVSSLQVWLQICFYFANLLCCRLSCSDSKIFSCNMCVCFFSFLLGDYILIVLFRMGTGCKIKNCKHLRQMYRSYVLLMFLL